MNNNSWEQGAGSSELKQLMLKPLQDKFPVWRRCSAPTLRLRARRVIFHTFSCFYDFWFGSVYNYVQISDELDYTHLSCPKLVAEFFYRLGTDPYQTLRQDAPSSIAIVELIMDCLLNHCVKTPEYKVCTCVYFCLSSASGTDSSAASQAVCEHQTCSAGIPQAAGAASQG